MSRDAREYANEKDAPPMKNHTEVVNLVDVILDDQFQVEKFLRYESHADVYSIRSLPISFGSFEARVYDLEGLPRKLRQYRLRNIKRLSNRAMLETQYEGRVVIVYKTSSEIQEDSEDSTNRKPPPKSLPPDEKPNLNVGNIKTKQKTDHQREIERMRQLERRKSKREDRRRMKLPATSEGESPKTNRTEIENPWKTDDERCSYFMLYISLNIILSSTHSAWPEFWEQLPFACQETLKRYLQELYLKFRCYDNTKAKAVVRTPYHTFLVGITGTYR